MIFYRDPNESGISYLVAVGTGLEPATSCVTGRHSNQLNYPTKFLRRTLSVTEADYVAFARGLIWHKWVKITPEYPSRSDLKCLPEFYWIQALSLSGGDELLNPAWIVDIHNRKEPLS